MIRRATSIRQQFTRMNLLATGAVLLLTGGSFFAGGFFAYRRAAAQALSALGQVIAINSASPLASDNRGAANEILATLRAEPNVTAAVLYTRGGMVFARYPAALRDDEIPPAPEEPPAEFTSATLTIQPVIVGGERIGLLYVRSNVRAMHGSFSIYAALGVLGVGCSLLVFFLLSRSLEARISRQIIELTEKARLVVERHDYSLRAAKRSDDELGALSEAFNRLLSEIQTLTQKLEHRLNERTQQLEGASKELESFSYSVSHDLRAPLRHIDGFAAMLTAQAGDRLDEQSRHYLTVITDAARRMGRLIDALLIFSRSGRVELRFEEVKLDDLIRDVRIQLQPEVAGRTIGWRIAPLPAVRGDLALLRQVFANLLSNAIKYTRRRSDAAIEVGGESGEPGETVVFVRDNGAGFNPKYTERLFGVFQRLHAESEFEGTGVGLAIVQRIVVRHGGRVWAEGAVDAGATFYVALPSGGPAAPEG